MLCELTESKEKAMTFSVLSLVFLLNATNKYNRQLYTLERFIQLQVDKEKLLITIIYII